MADSPIVRIDAHEPPAPHQIREIPELALDLNPALRPLSPLARESYNYQIRLFNSWNAGRPLAPSRILEYFQEIADQFSTRTLHLKRAALRYGVQLTFSDAAAGLLWQKALDLLFRQIRIPAPDSAVSAQLLVTREEIITLIAECKNPALALMIEAYYYSGCRNSELLALRLRSVNGVADGWAVVSIVGKGAKTRTIAAWPAELHAAILERFRPEKASDFLFKNTHPASRSGGYSRRYTYKAVAALSAAVIGRRIKVHDIRHRHATECLEQGMALESVAARLGHADPSTTLRIYAHRHGTGQLDRLRLTQDIKE